MATFTKKKKVGLLATVLVLGISGAAFAYWTAGGTGTGTATTGTNVNLVAVQTSVVTGMAPGDTPQSLSGDIQNNGSGPTYVGTVTASILSVDKAPGATVGVCDASNYTLATPAMAVDAEVDPGTTQDAWTGATIKFNNKLAVNQDACKSATVNLVYTIS